MKKTSKGQDDSGANINHKYGNNIVGILRQNKVSVEKLIADEIPNWSGGMINRLNRFSHCLFAKLRHSIASTTKSGVMVIG